VECGGVLPLFICAHEHSIPHSDFEFQYAACPLQFANAWQQGHLHRHVVWSAKYFDGHDARVG
jgi:hypothetical protein